MEYFNKVILPFIAIILIIGAFILGVNLIGGATTLYLGWIRLLAGVFYGEQTYRTIFLTFVFVTAIVSIFISFNLSYVVHWIGKKYPIKKSKEASNEK